MTDKQQECISELFHENYPKLLRFANKQLNDIHKAEDLAMDTMEVAVKNIDRLLDSPNPTGWLFKTLEYKIMHEKRAQAVRSGTVSLEQIEDIPEKDSSVPTFILSGLTDDEEKLIKMVYYERQTMAETAETLHITPACCRKRVQKIRDKLKKFFEK